MAPQIRLLINYSLASGLITISIAEVPILIIEQTVCMSLCRLSLFLFHPIVINAVGL